jgi:hypothetical protein
MLILVIVVSPGNSLKLGNSNDNGFITMTDSYTTGWDTTMALDHAGARFALVSVKNES